MSSLIILDHKLSSTAKSKTNLKELKHLEYLMFYIYLLTRNNPYLMRNLIRPQALLIDKPLY